MSITREIISLQFGHYSNYIGSHFWNVQELSFDYTGKKSTDVNHDVLYREGLTIDGKVTYTPRLLLADLKNSLKTLPEHGVDQPTCSNTLIEWPNVEIRKEPEVEKNEYLKQIDGEYPATDTDDNFGLDSNVSTWTDFLYPRFHSRTVNVVNEYEHNNIEVPFETYNAGVKTWKTEQFSEIFTDNIRHYVEECDSIQGFQITLDSTDGFGGLATQCLQHLSDEYANKAIFAIPVIASHFPDNDANDPRQREISNMKDSVRLVNIALVYENLFENASLFVPMCCGEKGWRKPGMKRQFQSLNYDIKNYYHTSSILASAIDTISLKYRQKSNLFSLSDICADMTGYGRKMAAISLGLPFDMNQKDYLIDHLDKVDSPLWTSLTPNCDISTDKVFQHITVRGIPEGRLKKPLNTAKQQLQMAAYKCSSVQEMFQLYFQCNYFASASNVTISPYGLEVITPFPKIFSKDLNKSGFLKEFVDNEVAESVPVISGLHNGAFVFDTLESLQRDVKRVKFAKLHKYKEDGLEPDDFADCLNRLEEASYKYEDNLEL